MLGEVLSDPHHVETGGMVKGMGLLPIDTVFSKQKTRSRVKGRFLKLDGDLYPISGAPFEGYEIHMGISSQHGNAKPLTFFEDKGNGVTKLCGTWVGNVYGTYLHGIFDLSDTAEKIVRAIGEKKGIDLSDAPATDYRQLKEEQYDLLADELRKHLDMEKIYEILHKGAED